MDVHISTRQINIHMVLYWYKNNNVYFITGSDSHGPTHAFGRVVSNDNDQDRTVSIRGRSFLVPPKSSFLLSDLSKINPLYDHACKCYAS